MYIIVEVGSTGTYYSAPLVFAIQCASLLSVGAKSEGRTHRFRRWCIGRPLKYVLVIRTERGIEIIQRYYG
jgi:hypothetical protein